jgi:UDP-GlcNAc3NAcA epimerase
MIVTIIGARPQFVKAAVVSRALRNIGLEEKIVHTGQHYDDKMSEVFWTELGIPAYDINLNVGSGTHAQQTAQMLVKIEQFLLENKERVKGVLLYGDTNSTIAGALVAAKLGVKIIHVEAGLRSFNRAMPEEINRIVTDQLSDILFCPSASSVTQLASEGIRNNVFDVGDVMYDAMLQFSTFAKSTELAFSPGTFNLMTVHRPSNTDDVGNLNSIMSALAEEETSFLWPVHPRTRKVIEINKIAIPANVKLEEPLSYFEMLAALRSCHKVLTDSGGLQKEAYWMKKPCVTLREQTEWVETLHNNWNILTGPDQAKITNALRATVDESSWKPLYGNGRAAEEIASRIRQILY